MSSPAAAVAPRAFDPQCAHASARPKGRLVILWWYCDVRAKDIHKPEDCQQRDGRRCPSWQKCQQQSTIKEAEVMPKYYDWEAPFEGDERDERDETRREAAGRMFTEGATVAAVAKALGAVALTVRRAFPDAGRKRARPAAPRPPAVQPPQPPAPATPAPRPAPPATPPARRRMSEGE
jgi:hypothetical protein